QIDEELWDSTMTRLTLFIDPGRIKRGVLPLEEVGPALEAGKRYTLVIDREWLDGAGMPLKDGFQKSFSVGPPDREPIDPKRWQIQSPFAGTRDALSINFAESLDQALAQRLIAVALESGEIVAGEISLSEHERRWTFSPANSWRRGRYHLHIQTTLEDLAGNNIGKPFDVDTLAGTQRQIAASTARLPFEVR
ncbi:MAG TPA: Ig-like domain-containing protein, partial [Blastocatellia bacterium]